MLLCSFTMASDETTTPTRLRSAGGKSPVGACPARNRIVNIQLMLTSTLFLPSGLDGRKPLRVGGGAPGAEALLLPGWPSFSGTTAASQAARTFAM